MIAAVKSSPTGNRECDLYMDGYGGIVRLLRCKQHPDLRALLPVGPESIEPTRRAIEAHTGAVTVITKEGNLEW